ncbi:oxalurate catabolism protein HpxZ [Gordonia insulae]|uniref:DUF4440 domain-containing protein n=1 Tax=Gordonia insulae TaxID=2420509 RepID=A0A3G8JHI5_9ACTN|nr:oxalurate catabolism protein HpxZ [Gordonia insulae]AZG44557.1 hypothetical protein D7316_01143 [Gordonia insulae]
MIVADLDDARAEVREAFDRYDAALVSNDIGVLDELFADDPRTIRFGAGEELFGYDEIREFRSRRSGQGLARTLERVEITPLSPEVVLANAVFRRDERVVRQSQVWMRLEPGWRVVSAHVSTR